MKNFVQHGDRIRHTLTAAVTSGDPVVVGTGLLGVALEDGAIGETIDCAIEGVFELPKLNTAVIAAGEQCLYDSSAGNLNDDQAVPAAGDFLCGYAWEAAGNGTTIVRVKINRPAPSVT